MTDLRSYISQVKKMGQLHTISKKVSTKFEIASLTAQVDGANAILFDNIRESKLRLVANLVGNRARFAKAVSSTEDTIHQKIITAISKAKKPKISSTGKFFENKSRDLSILPIVTHFEKESGPFITSSVKIGRAHV